MGECESLRRFGWPGKAHSRFESRKQSQECPRGSCAREQIEAAPTSRRASTRREGIETAAASRLPLADLSPTQVKSRPTTPGRLQRALPEFWLRTVRILPGWKSWVVGTPRERRNASRSKGPAHRSAMIYSLSLLARDAAHVRLPNLPKLGYGLKSESSRANDLVLCQERLISEISIVSGSSAPH